MDEEKISLSSWMEMDILWREILVKFALLFFCLTIWRNELNLPSFLLLILAWLLDNGLGKLRLIINEPLVQSILVLCAALLLGLLWSDLPEIGRLKWKKYFILLMFIPFLSLLNKKRLPWAMTGLLVGYASVLFAGIYQFVILGEPGVALFKMSYLSFSAMLGIGVILAVYLADMSCYPKRISILLWIFALILLFIQFNQNGRGVLLATLIALSFLFFLLNREKIRRCGTILLSFIMVVSLFAFSNTAFQGRLVQAKHDIALFQQGNYSTSVGYRLAMWDVGLDGIAKRPLLGHGTGMPESYFENSIVTYKEGIYKDLPRFHRTSHYHNDWIEIGMHIGILGMLTLAFLLWSWYRTFKVHHLPVLGMALVSYIFLAGLTDTFIIYSRIPLLLLVITAIAICWQKKCD